MIARTLTLAAMLGAMAVPHAAVAQETEEGAGAVALEPSLLEHMWWAIEFEGKTPGSQAPTFKMEDNNKIVVGTTQCDTDWYANTTVNFPSIRFDTPQTGAYSCEGKEDIRTFFDLLERVTAFRTSPQGLELVDATGKRLVLMVAGG